MSSHESDSDISVRVQKRRKLKKRSSNQKKRKTEAREPVPILSLEPLLYPVAPDFHADDDFAFDETMESLLPDYLQARLLLQGKASEYDDEGSYLRPLTRAEAPPPLVGASESVHNPRYNLLIRKLKLLQERRREQVSRRNTVASQNFLHETQPILNKPEPKPQVLLPLQDIKTTSFGNSLLSRCQGTRGSTSPSLIAVDWETITPWMGLLRDIRDHYSLARPERQQPIESLAPITYCTLQRSHLDQIHDLLQRVFWTGIDVSDSLEYSPERCTVIACYKKLVVGVVILSSPQESYITYLAVKAGWDKAQIARTMLFHLIKMNPGRDITLHVSANNSAMLLYNQFGFKAEEFIVGFYDDYLDPTSRTSKNAFRLRLRQ